MLDNPFRNSNAYYFIPTEDEWVKAAYWNSTNLQTWANASSSDLVSGSPDPTKWNYSPSAGSEPWNVGSGSEELNGTYDMMGNVWEWNETLSHGSDLGIRGGAYASGAGTTLSSSFLSDKDPYIEDNDIGFRVASIPEPTTLLLLGLGGVLIRKRR